MTIGANHETNIRDALHIDFGSDYDLLFCNVSIMKQDEKLIFALIRILKPLKKKTRDKVLVVVASFFDGYYEPNDFK